MGKSAAWSFFLAFHSLSAVHHGASATSSDRSASASATTSRSARPNVCAFEPGAKVSDACASYAELDALNAKLHQPLHELVSEADFFSYYRLNLYNKVCPFWSDENGVCGNIACAVTTVEDEEEIPLTWRAEELSRLRGPHAQHPGKDEQRERSDKKPLQGELGANVDESCVVEYDDECDERDYCVPDDESASAKGDYVSLVENPERFTGYAGEGAKQVWEAIYRENCFSKPAANGRTNAKQDSPFGALSGPKAQASMDLRHVMVEHGRQQALQTGSIEDQMEFDDDCVEKRVFYRIISGMHASISTHLCYDYFNQSTGLWGPNLECYQDRVQKHPDRLSNLYFNYAIVARAVAKLKDYVQDYTFCTGDPIEDARTKGMVTALAQELPSGTEIFDENVMFRDTTPSGGITLKEDFRNRFRNVSRIMDCVGCDKCRLWGKLQTAGYGTALKVLFEFGPGDTGSKPLLRRTELIALINTLDKISQALRIVGDFQTIAEEESAPPAATNKWYGYEDDDLEVHDTHDERPKPPPMGLREVFWLEYNRVMEAYIFVLKQWVSLPSKVWDVIKMESVRAYRSFSGLPNRPRTWAIRWRDDGDEL